MRESCSRNGRISLAPSEQLTPTTSGLACSTETQNASAVWPDRLRPLRSIAVNESQSGSSGATSAAATIAALRVERVEDRLDQEQVDAAVDERGDLLGIARPHLLERDRPERRVVDLRRDGERDVQRADGAGDEPRPVRSRAVHASAAATGEPRTLAAHLRRVLPEVVVGLADRRRRERVRRRDVRAGREVRVMDLRDELGPAQVEEVGVALDVAPVVAKRSPR